MNFQKKKKKTIVKSCCAEFSYFDLDEVLAHRLLINCLSFVLCSTSYEIHECVEQSADHILLHNLQKRKAKS